MRNPTRLSPKRRHKRPMGTSSERKREQDADKALMAVAAGKRIRWVRELSGYKQDKVVDGLGITQGELSRWENGKRNPPPPHRMPGLCDKLRISMDYIYRGHLIGVHEDLARELLRLYPGEVVPPPMYTGWRTDKDQP